MAGAGVSLALGRRERTKVRNRATILAAARKVFASLGYEGASVRDIVRASNLSVGTFYEYFRDKGEVFRAVAEEAWAGLRARLREARRDRSISLPERVYQAYLAYFRFVQEERGLYEVLERMLWSGSHRAEESFAVSLEELREDLLLDWNAAALGGEDPGLVAAAIVGTGLMVARQALAEGRLDPEEAARFCTRFVLRGATEASSSNPAPRRRLTARRRGTAESRSQGRDL
jgi:AcrR family transcriptional regulator